MWHVEHAVSPPQAPAGGGARGREISRGGQAHAPDAPLRQPDRPAAGRTLDVDLVGVRHLEHRVADGRVHRDARAGGQHKRDLDGRLGRRAGSGGGGCVWQEWFEQAGAWADGRAWGGRPHACGARRGVRFTLRAAAQSHQGRARGARRAARGAATAPPRGAAACTLSRARARRVACTSGAPDPTYGEVPRLCPVNGVRVVMRATPNAPLAHLCSRTAHVCVYRRPLVRAGSPPESLARQRPLLPRCAPPLYCVLRRSPPPPPPPPRAG